MTDPNAPNVDLVYDYLTPLIDRTSPRFIDLGEDVWVNPEHVHSVTRNQYAPITIVAFAGSTVTTRLTVAETVALLTGET